MQVSDAMTHDCQSISTQENLQTAARRMRDSDIGMLLVMDEGNQVSGILTDRDIAVRAVAEGIGPDQAVGSCMTRQPVACHAEDDLENAAKLMEREQVRRLLVRDANEQPVGVLSQADVARELGRSALVGEMMRDISQPSDRHSQH